MVLIVGRSTQGDSIVQIILLVFAQKDQVARWDTLNSNSHWPIFMMKRTKIVQLPLFYASNVARLAIKPKVVGQPVSARQELSIGKDHRKLARTQ